MNETQPPSESLEFDEDFFEWEERDESISYLNHCIGTQFTQLSLLIHNLAGSIAGVVEHVLLLPFDSIKVLEIFTLS